VLVAPSRNLLQILQDEAGQEVKRKEKPGAGQEVELEDQGVREGQDQGVAVGEGREAERGLEVATGGGLIVGRGPPVEGEDQEVEEGEDLTAGGGDQEPGAGQEEGVCHLNVTMMMGTDFMLEI